MHECVSPSLLVIHVARHYLNNWGLGAQIKKTV